MPLTPEAKQRLMEKLKGGATPKEPPPRNEDEPMDPEERMVDDGELVMDEPSEPGEGEDPNAPMDPEERMVEESEPPMPPEDQGAVGPSTYTRRREEERRIGGPNAMIDRHGMRAAAREAVDNAAQGRR